MCNLKLFLSLDHIKIYTKFTLIISRVEGRGSATITEVAFQTKQLTPDESTIQNEKEKQLRYQLEEAERRHNILNVKQHRLRKQRDVLDGFADNVVKAGNDGVKIFFGRI